MNAVNVMSISVSILLIALIILFFVSFTMFIRRLIRNENQKAGEMERIEQKLDYIIELLDKKRK